MPKIVKFIYVMIIIISLFLVATNDEEDCFVDADCVNLILCDFDEKPKCIINICQCFPWTVIH
ncbi:putative Late nodulin [Medicago truncatula]|uniref:Nodule Cysteine-Rich (NCR) secreted peptide n=1 Tax=Medicago truncatula TaxID=3880 RepID=G7IX62_MEDTR|nr:Nodule Cysteine-Rich (NCR) secreted peptide [Medicago truncatula]RHN66373.1 putative Late nodulin [Medicago truncatula]